MQELEALEKKRVEEKDLLTAKVASLLEKIAQFETARTKREEEIKEMERSRKEALAALEKRLAEILAELKKKDEIIEVRKFSYPFAFLCY